MMIGEVWIALSFQFEHVALSQQLSLIVGACGTLAGAPERS
jgi:hypothetical protein